MENFTDLNIEFNVATMTYEVGPSLSFRKALIIDDISLIEEHLGKGPIDIDRFEYLMGLSLSELNTIINDQSELLVKIKSSRWPT